MGRPVRTTLSRSCSAQAFPDWKTFSDKVMRLKKWITLISSLSCIFKLSHYVATKGARKLAMENPFSDLTKALDITFSGTFRMNKQ